jgi:hypothetical protein
VKRGGTPGKLGLQARGAPVRGAEAEKTKRRGGYRRRSAPGDYISNVGEGVDVTNIYNPEARTSSVK